MAASTVLRAVRRVYLDYHYAAQGSLVQNEPEQLIERPLRLFDVAADLSLSNVLQFFQYNAPTMFCGVVHNLFGHHVIFILCASRLFVANLVKQTPFPKTLQIGFLSPPYGFRFGGIKAQMQNFSILRVG